ncbi:MAG: DNA mismatch repair protein MutS [candidate division WS1 bacterium]|nr:DNA mismatch repair protein MutS [candidate division WS1 bacterium]
MPKSSEYTPLFRQWESLKKQHPEVLVLFRLGDFYEMFGEDAEIGARELGLVLTSRESGPGRRIPMCGLPHHALQRYLVTLVQKGFRVALADQMEDPKQAKGLVRREVTRVVSAGTVLEDNLLGGPQHNYLMAVARVEGRYGVALLEVSTGAFLVTEPSLPVLHPAVQPELGGSAHDPALAALLEEIARVAPAEVVLPVELGEEAGLRRALEQTYEGAVTVSDAEPDWRGAAHELREFFGVETLAGFGCEELPAAQAAAALALRYARQNHLEALPHLQGLTTYHRSEFMVVDATTRRNLELVRTLRDNSQRGSLLWLMDRTLTAMGARLLRDWLLQPLLSPAAINQRLSAVEELLQRRAEADRLRAELKAIADLERLMSRAATGTANARDLRALADSLPRLPEVAGILAEIDSELLRELGGQLSTPPAAGPTCTLQKLAEYLDRGLAEEPAAVLTEGGIIREGFSADLDELRALAAGGREWIANLQERERERTGIKSLKVGYNKVFGYYLEVSSANLSLVPENYQRKQTLSAAERFITPELKEQEARVLGAQERSQSLEYELFVEIRTEAARYAPAVMQAARALAALDVLQSLAQVALEYNYVRPEIEDSDRLEITGGRHPLVERLHTEEPFVPNDALLDCTANQLLVITGPNMAGKSTYLRQVALIVLLAQMGSFVPASAARLGVVDRIFTRVGASDDLATGQSTFMVEMTEAANILQNATDRSLIVLDEIGRGTSTFDGLSLAWAMAEFIVREIGAKTLFATHYHHLNELTEVLPRVVNYRIAVKEEGDRIVFLRRIMPGGTDRSYGIQVARLAGLPESVIERAREVLHSLEQEDLGRAVGPSREAVQGVGGPMQLHLFEAAPDPIVEEIKGLDPDTMTPLEALGKVKEWWEKVRKK